MKDLRVQLVIIVALFIIAHLLIDKESLIAKGEIKRERDGYVYIMEYEVRRYEQEKTKTDKIIDQGYYHKDRHVLEGSRRFDIWNWID